MNKFIHHELQPFNGLFSRTTWVSRYQKGKTNLDFTGARDSEWQWHQLGDMQVCTSLQTDNHASTSQVFLQAGCPSCRPTNSVKALKAQRHTNVPTTLWKKSRKSHFCSNLILKFHTAIKYILQSWSLLYYFTNDKLFTADVVRSLKIINVCYLQLKSTPVTVTAVIC